MSVNVNISNIEIFLDQIDNKYLSIEKFLPNKIELINSPI